MTDFKFWKPEHLGHAPRDWNRGPVLYRQCEEDSWKGVNDPIWSSGLEYKYLATIEDKNDAQFDVDAWIAQGHANLDAVQAKGVTLPPAPEDRDWADEVWWAILETHTGTEAIAVIRNLCRPREENDG